MNTGLVIKNTGSNYTVSTTDGQKFDCKIKGKLRINDSECTNPIAIGDWVEFSIDPNQSFGVISKVLNRKNYIIRKSSNLSKQYHIIAANIDHAYLIVTPAYPETTTIFIDRYLATAEAYRIEASIIFNKIDIYTDEMRRKVEELKKIYEPIGYKCYEISAIQNINIDIIKQALINKVNVLSGHSGVGKSSIINAIEPSLKIKIGDISTYHERGTHTTTFSEMYELTSGGFIIDTPGIKGFGITDMYREEIYHFFPEIFRISSYCKYNNCLHINEPGCAVKKAIEKGQISQSRYISYLNIYNDNDGTEKYRKPH